jgi:hypothetical protein
MVVGRTWKLQCDSSMCEKALVCCGWYDHLCSLRGRVETLLLPSPNPKS